VIVDTARLRRDFTFIKVPAQLAADLALLTAHRTDLTADRPACSTGSATCSPVHRRHRLGLAGRLAHRPRALRLTAVCERPPPHAGVRQPLAPTVPVAQWDGWPSAWPTGLSCLITPPTPAAA
jgi:hypothetical protein